MAVEVVEVVEAEVAVEEMERHVFCGRSSLLVPLSVERPGLAVPASVEWPPKNQRSRLWSSAAICVCTIAVQVHGLSTGEARKSSVERDGCRGICGPFAGALWLVPDVWCI